MDEDTFGSIALNYKIGRDGLITIKEALKLLERATCKLNTLKHVKE